MKRFLYILSVFIVFSGTLCAGTVSSKEAKDIASRFLRNYLMVDDKYAVIDAKPVASNGKINFYHIELSPRGWVLISANDIVQPVLGYSLDSEFIEGEFWNSNTKNWLNHYSEQIENAEKSGRSVRHSGWVSYQMNLKSVQEIGSVEPFIDAEWGQGNSWNMFCPEDENGPGGHALVGCVAVAMGQALSVYQYPVRPAGKHGYSHDVYGSVFVNFDYEPEYNWDEMNSTSANEYSAALLYHCGVTVDMDYGPDGSGAVTNLAKTAFVNYFGYPAGVTEYVEKYEDIEAWKALLKAELDAGRPIIYDGDADDGEAGHAFNIDGYTGDFFHLNWGWNGSMNGFFTINDLTPGSYDFTKNQNALIGIRPPVAGPKDIKLSKTSVKENLSAGSFVAKVTVIDEIDGNKYSFKLYGAGDITGNYDTALFYIENDSIKTKATFNYKVQKEIPLNIVVSDTLDNTYTEEFIITVLENKVISQVSDRKAEDGIKIFPNPAKGYFFLGPEGSINNSASVSIISLDGKVIKQINNYIPGSAVSLDNLAPGIYHIQVYGEYPIYKKLIVN